ncbi:MAG: hypothetical protein ACREDD_09735 [Methylocella sp.]
MQRDAYSVIFAVMAFWFPKASNRRPAEILGLMARKIAEAGVAAEVPVLADFVEQVIERGVREFQSARGNHWASPARALRPFDELRRAPSSIWTGWKTYGMATATA